MATPMPNEFVRRDEMRKALDDQLERVISYVDVALDAQRVKTVRQVATEVSADLDRKLTVFSSAINDRLVAASTDTDSKFATLFQYLAQMKQEIVQEIIQALQKPI